ALLDLGRYVEEKRPQHPDHEREVVCRVHDDHHHPRVVEPERAGEQEQREKDYSGGDHVRRQDHEKGRPDHLFLYREKIYAANEPTAMVITVLDVTMTT